MLAISVIVIIVIILDPEKHISKRRIQFLIYLIVGFLVKILTILCTDHRVNSNESNMYTGVKILNPIPVSNDLSLAYKLNHPIRIRIRILLYKLPNYNISLPMIEPNIEFEHTLNN